MGHDPAVDSFAESELTGMHAGVGDMTWSCIQIDHETLHLVSLPHDSLGSPDQPDVSECRQA
jgi:hypothetical protein